MADAQAVALAKQTLAELNAGTFETSFTATRSYKPQAKLESTGTVKVLVAISELRQLPDNRAEWEYQYDIDIAVLYRAGDTLTEAQTLAFFDVCMRLLEQIADFYRFTRPATANSDCRLIAVNYGGPTGMAYFAQHIQEFNQFTGVIRLTFEQVRT